MTSAQLIFNASIISMPNALSIYKKENICQFHLCTEMQKNIYSMHTKLPLIKTPVIFD